MITEAAFCHFEWLLHAHFSRQPAVVETQQETVSSQEETVSPHNPHDGDLLHCCQVRQFPQCSRRRQQQQHVS